MEIGPTGTWAPLGGGADVTLAAIMAAQVRGGSAVHGGLAVYGVIWRVVAQADFGRHTGCLGGDLAGSATPPG